MNHRTEHVFLSVLLESQNFPWYCCSLPINKPWQREKDLMKWVGVMWSLWEEYWK